MVLNREQYYKAVCFHDSTFDGHFFWGAKTTGIYCRPVCKTRAPKFENCHFFSSTAAAEIAGFRPCLRCRPEQAPRNNKNGYITQITKKAMELIEEGFLNEEKTKTLAKKVGISDRYLRKIFQAELGMTPVSFAQIQRLLISRHLLSETPLPVTEIAFAAGFNSLRRFNVSFKNKYGVCPTNFRRGLTPQKSIDPLVFNLRYQSSLDWKNILNFLQEKAIPRIEEVQSGVYKRILRIEQRGRCYTGWVKIENVPLKSVLQVTIDISLSRVVLLILKYVRLLFGLNCPIEKITEALGPLAKNNSPKLRLIGAFNGFEIAIQTILNQHVSTKEAQALSEKFVSYFGEAHLTHFSELTHIFPNPELIANTSIDEMYELGIPSIKAQTIISLAQAVIDKNLTLSSNDDVSKTLERLRGIPNLNESSIQYIIMRALSWPDAFPYNEKDIIKALDVSTYHKAQECIKAWHPWRSYAAMHLWYKLREKNK